jgi:hypothetical protein
MEDHLGMGIEGDHDGFGADQPCFLDDLVKNIAMTDMDPVKIADRDVGIVEVGSKFLKGPEYLHGLGCLSPASVFATYHSINFGNFKLIFA